ncbi:MAG: response regulator transcription factor [Clostridia bacterium]|nr:response regulator transcription factor [Clostridia bacterium]
MKQKILVVDDEAPICDLLKINLESEGYEVAIAFDGRDALKKVESFKPDLMILDVMLPEINGFEICKRVTAERPIPIIMLTAKSDLVDKVLGLELGADDYITKPFHPRELIARVKVLFRRISSDKNTPSKILENGPLTLEPDKRQVLLSGAELDLSVKEYDLLYFLLSNLDQVFSREVLLDRVWGYDFAGDTRTVDVHIQRLRKKLKCDNPAMDMIHTVFGVGYKIKRLKNE